MGWIGLILLLDLAVLCLRFGCLVDSFVLKYWLAWVVHLVGLEIWLGKCFCWIGHLVGYTFSWVVDLVELAGLS